VDIAAMQGLAVIHRLNLMETAKRLPSDIARIGS